MKKLLLFIFVFSVLCSFGKNRGDEVDLRIYPHFKKSEFKVYSIKESCVKFCGKNKLSEETSEYDAIISVDSILADGYILKWKCRGFKVHSPHIFFKRLGEMCEGIEILYKTDKKGTFSDFYNYKEVHDFISRSIDSVANEFKNVAHVDAVLEQFRNSVSSPESLKKCLLKEIQIFHSVHGEIISTSKNIEFKQKLPNLFGGTPFVGVCSMEIKNIDKDSKICTVAVNKTINKEKAQACIYRYLKNIARRMARAVPLKEQIPEVQVSDSSYIAINMDSGWLVRAKNSETISAGSMTQQTSTIITEKSFNVTELQK